ncbi:von Willebrand factor A domain-containing protein 3B-like [Anolis sagrei]|uniref:von Willebrand factor A domain-containing protein 3B-like n=1 Tax=Anolis sagrei TaxID=38937 RepID=UPI00352308A0
MSHRYRGALPVADIHESNVAFVICASESDLWILKEVLIKTLFSLPNKLLDSTFNIISCSNEVLKWQTGLVMCSLMAVTEAATWIRALKVGIKGNVLNAVTSALENPACQAVYLFTNGLHEGRVEELWRYLKDTEQTRPVHIIYLVESGEERKDSARKILEKVANESGGSCQVLNFSSDGTSSEDKPGCTVGISCSLCISKQHPTPWLTGHCRTQSPSSTWSPHSPNIFLEGSIKENVENWSSKFHNLQRGIRVLTRKQTDGYYYPGHIIQKVKS